MCGYSRIAGCKQYGLRKRVQVGGNAADLSVLKCKGYSKEDRCCPCFGDFVALNSGASIEQKQM